MIYQTLKSAEIIIDVLSVAILTHVALTMTNS